MNRVYLDHSASTPVLPEVLDAMKPYYLSEYGNASSLHGFGTKARRALEESREIVAKFIGGSPDSIIFTGSGTEADNLAIQGTYFKNKGKQQHFITSAIEHPAVLSTCQFMEDLGVKVSYLPVNGAGIIDPETIQARVTDKTDLISIMYANNEIGTIQPITEIGRIASTRNIAFHTDAVQALGTIRIDVKKSGINMLSASGHKLYAPKGVGFLYIDDKNRISPILRGGGHEYGLRPSTENVPSIVGLAKAVEIISKDLEREAARELQLREYLVKHVLAEISGSSLNGSRAERLPGNANLSFEGVSGFDLVLVLDREGIAVSTGSACHSSSAKPSHVLLAIGCSEDDNKGTIRISIGRQTTQEQIDYVLEKLSGAIKELRSEKT
ncbi:MAG: cysteine desulfurase [Candidatus Lokiarchaeota archaeon]|nr:cysteine desulfurase [Candidatus Lokiarchaeota archaeon]